MKASGKKVVVAMSGGVDSSVAAVLLKEMGYECIGMHLRFWSELPEETEGNVRLPQNKCCSVESLEDARRVAHSLGIPFYVMNTVEPFKEKVVDAFLEGYRQGETPNPCVECNRNIKFGALLKRASELGADFLATGHYIKKINGSEAELWMAKDKAKDQSYFLYHLGQEKLAKLMFPLGDYTKEEVYGLAEKFGLNKVREKKESQGVCFFAERTPDGFLKRNLESEFVAPGPIETVSGKIIGRHEGLPFYTIGQRKGIKIGGLKEEEGNSQAWFVVGFDRKRNALLVGRKQDLLQDCARVRSVSFVSGRLPGGRVKVQARIRYRFPPVPAWFEAREFSSADAPNLASTAGSVIFETPVAGLSPGQSMVFYDGEKVLGGGKIVG